MLVIGVTCGPLLLGNASQIRYDAAAEIERVPVVIDHNLGTVRIGHLVKRSIGCEWLYKRGYIGLRAVEQILYRLQLRGLDKRLVSLDVHNHIGLYSAFAERLETTVRSALMVAAGHHRGETALFNDIEYTLVISCHEHVVKHLFCLLADADDYRFASQYRQRFGRKAR